MLVHRTMAALAANGEVGPKCIRRLEEVVVNRIAAGEVIHRPVSALKEMLENSLDAGSTMISVSCKGGGIKMLQIQDNGHGIRKEDLPIVCERFTTSKLTKYEDLRQIATFGFRGEALASISHVAHVTIVSTTSNQPCAFRAHYSDGKMVAQKPGETSDPKACAGVRGTIITVEDLFYNVVTRRKALKSPTEEYQKILDVASKYAIQYAGVGITCKKHGESSADVHTVPNASRLDNIRTIYGAPVARELLAFEHKKDSLKFSSEGFVSNANYSLKKAVFILFINNRLVDCGSLKKAVELVYSAYLPKQTHPFIFLSICMAPQNVDVNVHPTKSEVRFLHEDEIIESIQKALEAKLVGANSSRTFYTQSLLPSSSQAATATNTTSLLSTKGSLTSLSSTSVTSASAPTMPSTPSQTPKEAPQRMVRTSVGDQSGRMELFVTRGAGPQENGRLTKRTAQQAGMSASLTRKHPRAMKAVRLTSVLHLRAEIESRAHQGLADMFKNHTFVGAVDETFALIQHRTKLYLVNARAACKELMYQQAIHRFANFGTIQLTPPAPIQHLIRAALDSPRSGWTTNDAPKDELAADLVLLLQSRAPMLEEYFQLKLSDDGLLHSLPLVVDGLVPDLSGLAMFLLRFATRVVWDAEQECFQCIARELAHFYQHYSLHNSSPHPKQDPPDSITCEQRQQEPSESESQPAEPSPHDHHKGSSEGSSGHVRVESASANQSDAPSELRSGIDQHVETVDLTASARCASSDEKVVTKDVDVNGTVVANGIGPKAGTTPFVTKYAFLMQHVLFPSLRIHLSPPCAMASDGSVVQVACLENLYKVFERC
mmetsp:Transcript_22979/g.39449  ORF Transcript_22979/g.39449 Transcript_22979/m.39449 type:complete len:830 (+) Transcript_22979:3-2492(+)